jgi:hypothetical protein
MGSWYYCDFFRGLLTAWIQVTSNANEASKCHGLLAERFRSDLNTFIHKGAEEMDWSSLKQVHTSGG